MKKITCIGEMQKLTRGWQKNNEVVGFAPTMGCLHQGHLSLIEKLREHGATKIVTSIFVNPTQFGANEDFSKYPRTLETDLELCEKYQVDAVFIPQTTDMYNGNASTWVEETELSRNLCGASRPGHFRGVATIVVKLLNAVQPDFLALGQKDAQQALVLTRVIRDLNISTQVIICPIVRESDGLAMSSRNRYLNDTDRKAALSINRSLKKAAEMFASGQKNAAELRLAVVQEVEAANGRVDYVELVSRETLAPQMLATSSTMLAVAAYFGNTRLIDNIFLD